MSTLWVSQKRRDGPKSTKPPPSIKKKLNSFITKKKKKTKTKEKNLGGKKRVPHQSYPLWCEQGTIKSPKTKKLTHLKQAKRTECRGKERGKGVSEFTCKGGSGPNSEITLDLYEAPRGTKGKKPKLEYS